MKFITLTNANPVIYGQRPMQARINIAAIEAIYDTDSSRTGSTIGLASHNNGGFKCLETPDQVLVLIAHAEELE